MLRDYAQVASNLAEKEAELREHEKKYGCSERVPCDICKPLRAEIREIKSIMTGGDGFRD